MQTKEIQKVLVANRGEIAIRIFRACHDLGIHTVAIYSNEDTYSLFRTKADEAYLVGEKKSPLGAYLDIPGIIGLARRRGVTAIHPGYGFLSENADFARACEDNGILFVGPSSDVLAKMGDKLSAKEIAVQCGVPIIPGCTEPLKDADDALEKALSFGDLVWLFVIGAFLGDVVETLFCRVTAGVWMSRSSLVWGPFSVVWGLALVMAAVLLRGSEERSDRSIFLFGFVMGGAYEYICSAVGEMLFGVIFWDYSGFKFNLGGRVNLLYCFFWGIAAVVWIRYGYPLVAKLMANLKKHILPWMTVVLTVFMAVNMGLSALALARYDARTSGLAPANQLDVFLDEHFDNARMERVYPNAKKTG